MCKAHSKVTHIKQQIYFHHLKRPGYNTEFLLYPRPLRWWKYICCFICVTLLWALHIVIKQQFFTFIFAVFLLNFNNNNNNPGFYTALATVLTHIWGPIFIAIKLYRKRTTWRQRAPTEWSKKSHSFEAHVFQTLEINSLIFVN